VTSDRRRADTSEEAAPELLWSARALSDLRAIGDFIARDDPEAARRWVLKLTRAAELACVGCHSEKKGPFVYPHVGEMTGDSCLTCHEPHGSNNMKRLKRARVDQLCLECHTRLGANVLGSQPPSIHNLTQPRWQNCTTCHPAIHGSNRSPRLLK